MIAPRNACPPYHDLPTGPAAITIESSLRRTRMLEQGYPTLHWSSHQLLCRLLSNLTQTCFLLAMVTAMRLDAGILTFSDRPSFLAAAEAVDITGELPNLGGPTLGPVVIGGSGGITLTGIAGHTFYVGVPAYQSVAIGPTIAIDDTEQLDVAFDSAFSIGFDYDNPSAEPSIYVITLRAGNTVVDSFSISGTQVVRSFVGVLSDVAFDNIQIRETVGGIADQYFGRFYRGTKSGNLVFLPRIRVFAGEGCTASELTDEQSTAVVFGAPLGNQTSRTFTIRNGGNGSLTGLGITLDGTDADRFTLTASPTAPVGGPNGSTTFTVRFAPLTSGTKTAALHIASNDLGASSFDIALTGEPLNQSQDTDGDGMNDASESLLAAFGFDWQVSQPSLVTTYYSNANAAGLYTAAQVQILNMDTPLLTKDTVSGLFKLTIGVQKTTNFNQPFVPFPMTLPQTGINGQGKLEFEFSAPDDAAFFRLQAQ